MVIIPILAAQQDPEVSLNEAIDLIQLRKKCHENWWGSSSFGPDLKGRYDMLRMRLQHQNKGNDNALADTQIVTRLLAKSVENGLDFKKNNNAIKFLSALNGAREIPRDDSELCSKAACCCMSCCSIYAGMHPYCRLTNHSEIWACSGLAVFLGQSVIKWMFDLNNVQSLKKVKHEIDPQVIKEALEVAGNYPLNFDPFWLPQEVMKRD